MRVRAAQLVAEMAEYANVHCTGERLVRGETIVEAGMRGDNPRAAPWAEQDGDGLGLIGVIALLPDAYPSRLHGAHELREQDIVLARVGSLISWIGDGCKLGVGGSA